MDVRFDCKWPYLGRKRTIREMLDGVGEVTYRKKIANNTIEYKVEGDCNLYVRLHLTDILIKQPDGSVKLNTGGYPTVTTRNRINTYQDICSIHQTNYIWSVLTGQGSFDYQDNMTVFPSGEVLYADQLVTTELPEIPLVLELLPEDMPL